MKLNREALRAALPDPLAVIQVANKLGYVKGEFSNGFICIATPDGADWITFPQYSMRQANAVLRQIDLMPTIDMGR